MIFRVFNKENIYMNNFYPEIKGDFVIDDIGTLINFRGNHGFWKLEDKDKKVVIFNHELKKENLMFRIMEPNDYEYIDVYRVNGYYVAHDYNLKTNGEGIYYIIIDLIKFKEFKRDTYSYIQFNDNYIEEL